MAAQSALDGMDGQLYVDYVKVTPDNVKDFQ